MDWTLSESQQLLSDSARAFLAERLPDGVLKAMAAGAAGPDLWTEMAGLGWPGLIVPEEEGGIGGTLLDAVVLIETLGHACAPSPFAMSAVAATTLLKADAADGVEWLRRLASGDARLSLALAEASGEFTLDGLETTASARGGGHVVRGVKRFVPYADSADGLVVAARTESGPNFFLLSPSECALARMATLSGEPLFELRLDGVEAGPGLFPSAERARAAARGALAAGALARAAEMVGLAQRVLDVCVEYARVREQSGQPIGAFQAIQHRCADMLRGLEGARFLTYRTAWRLDEGVSDASDPGDPVAVLARDVAMTKAYAGEACLQVARSAHQVMGAIGYCEEHVLHLLHKRIQAASLDFGDSTSHLDEVASRLGYL